MEESFYACVANVERPDGPCCVTPGVLNITGNSTDLCTLMQEITCQASKMIPCSSPAWAWPPPRQRLIGSGARGLVWNRKSRHVFSSTPRCQVARFGRVLMCIALNTRNESGSKMLHVHAHKHRDCRGSHNGTQASCSGSTASDNGFTAFDMQ